MHAHLLSTQLVLDTFDTGFKSTQNRIEIKILVSSQPYHLNYCSRDTHEYAASMQVNASLPKKGARNRYNSAASYSTI